MKKKVSFVWISIGVVLLFAFGMSGLVACGDARTTAGSSPTLSPVASTTSGTASTQVPASPTTAAASATAAVSSPAPSSSPVVATPVSTAAASGTVGQMCGTVAQLPDGNPRDPVRSQLAGNCFWQAFSQCRPATLIYSASGVDTITTRIFTIMKMQGICTTSEAVQHRILPRQAGPAQIYICSHTSKNGSSLVFQGCGTDGNITVPLQ